MEWNVAQVVPKIRVNSMSVCKQNNKGSMKRYVEKLMKIYQYVSKTKAMTSEVQWCSFETRQVIIISLGVLTSGVYYFGVRIILTLKPLMH